MSNETDIIEVPIEDFDGSCPRCGSQDAMYDPYDIDVATDGVAARVECDCGMRWTEVFPACTGVQYHRSNLEEGRDG